MTVTHAPMVSGVASGVVRLDGGCGCDLDRTAIGGKAFSVGDDPYLRRLAGWAEARVGADVRDGLEVLSPTERIAATFAALEALRSG